MQQVFSFISSLNKFNQNSFFPCLRKLLFDLWAQTCGGDGDFGSHASFLSIWGAELDVGLSQGFHMSAQHWGGTSPTNSQQTFTNTTAEPWNRMIYMQGVLCFMANIQNHDMLKKKKKKVKKLPQLERNYFATVKKPEVGGIGTAGKKSIGD